MPNRVICAYYASPNYGSEYRAGFEFVRYAAGHGFDTAVIADLEFNPTAEEMQGLIPGIRVLVVPSVVRRQSTLYKLNDFIPQGLWHARVARRLRAQGVRFDAIWVHNGALPWLPLAPYLPLAHTVVWGPVGGGQAPPPMVMSGLPWREKTRERARTVVERFLLRRKLHALKKRGSAKLVTMARTSEAQNLLTSVLEGVLEGPVPVIPEILEPIEAAVIAKRAGDTPRMLWVGQDVPRKNLALALALFRELRKDFYPSATLDVFGCRPGRDEIDEGVQYHGWVARIDWQQYRNDGVLLLTSFREGLPSVVLEATANGLLCITSDVGAMASLNSPSVFVMPKEAYPNYSRATLAAVARRIQEHLRATTVHFPSVSYRQRLFEHLEAQSAVT